ncbi:MAG TPA: hypothetical protein VFZ09_51030 [Archangium sp.]|uniref:hypothetical protein n=1 Tax=Archangium sp. TaxID=1872627 RepID=UPI002E337199|nr:hypothetical protein [Archangium sp.]HEX5754622.1 hypothetical protein [Archangium sp.]
MLRILAARGLSVDGKSRQRILGCTDLDLLDLWLERALRANHLSDVLIQKPSTTGRASARAR